MTRFGSVSARSIAAALAVLVCADEVEAAAPTGGPGSLTGLWANARYKASERFPARDRVVMTTEEKPPPLQPWAAKLVEERIAASDKGEPFSNTLTQCLPAGMPGMMYGAGAYPIQIMESPGLVAMLFDEQNHFRLIYLDRGHPAEPDASYMGDSVGRWEGDTLIVDTIGLVDNTTLDMVGTPHSDALHIVERIRRTGPDTLEDLITIDDPKTFSGVWQTKAYLRTPRPDVGMYEYICENNRNAPDAKGRATFQMPGR